MTLDKEAVKELLASCERTLADEQSIEEQIAAHISNIKRLREKLDFDPTDSKSASETYQAVQALCFACEQFLVDKPVTH